MEDPPSMKFTCRWRIENFTKLKTKTHYSEIFVVGDYKWKVFIYPKGNNVDHLSMYLDVADLATLPDGWSRYAEFGFTVVNQLDSEQSVRKDTQHQFNAKENDWGFTSFMPLSDIRDPNGGYLVNDTFVVEVEVAIHKVLDSYNSKLKERLEQVKKKKEIEDRLMKEKEDKLQREAEEHKRNEEEERKRKEEEERVRKEDEEREQKEAAEKKRKEEEEEENRQREEERKRKEEEERVRKEDEERKEKEAEEKTRKEEEEEKRKIEEKKRKEKEENRRREEERKKEERKYIEEAVEEQKVSSILESDQDKDQAIQSLKISLVASMVPPQILISDSVDKDVANAEEIERELSGMVAVCSSSSLASSGILCPSVGVLSLGLGKLEELVEIEDPKEVLADPSLYSSFETVATLLLQKPEFLGQTKLSALRCFCHDLHLIQKAYTKSLELGKKVEVKETEKRAALDEADGFITRLNSSKSSLKNMLDRKEKLLRELNQLEPSIAKARIQLNQILEEKDQVQRTSTNLKDIEASLQEAKQEQEHELELIDDRWINLRSAFKK